MYWLFSICSVHSFRNADLPLVPGLSLFNPQYDYVLCSILGLQSRGKEEEEVVATVAAAAQVPSAQKLEKEKKEKERREEEEIVAQKIAQKGAKAGGQKK